MLKIYIKPSIYFNKPSKKFQISSLKPTKTYDNKELIHKYTRGSFRQAYSLNSGDNIHNFELKKIEFFKDFNLKAFHLKHKEFHLPFIHLDTCDTKNCLALIFRTPAFNNKGILFKFNLLITKSHLGIGNILENMIFCGSKQFPIRDPFLYMSKRSLNEHTNTWNGPGYTCYPFSTTNLKDFYNLLTVSLDISFNPLLTYHNFLNEGWRYDFSNQEEKKELNFKGRCYEEMKIYSQLPENIFLEAIKQTLFKNNEYSFLNGGTQEEITKLSYVELIEYYEKFYHPSNCKIYSYGDLDFTKHLEFINEYFLKMKSKVRKNFDVFHYKKTEISQIQENIQVACPPNPEFEKDRQAQIGIAFLCGDLVENPFLAIYLNVLSYILFETPYSPFFQLFLTSG